MNPIPFAKLSGSGNDFVIVDNRDQRIPPDRHQAFIKAVCPRALSVGADGVILIESDPRAECDFAWRFYNSDGSEAEMCGNGGRCAARFAYETGIAGKEMTFRTLAGVIGAQITADRTVKLQMTPPGAYDPTILLDGPEGQKLSLAFLEMGVPHAVMVVKDVEAVDVQTLGALIRYHQRFSPKGTNVNFLQITGPDSLLIRTYERGVEGETLACGTGSMASAVILALAGKVRPPVKLTTRSGELLTVEFPLTGGVPREIYFEGAVRWVYDGLLKEEIYSSAE